MSSPVALSYASGATLSAFSQSPCSASCTIGASESGIAQGSLVGPAAERDQVGAEVAEAVVRAAVLDDVRGAPQVPGVRPLVELRGGSR